MDLHVLLWIRHLVKTQGVGILTPPDMMKRIIGLSHLCGDGGASMFIQNEEWE